MNYALRQRLGCFIPLILCICGAALSERYTVQSIYTAPWCAPCPGKKVALLNKGAKLKVVTVKHGKATPTVYYRTSKGKTVWDNGQLIDSGKYRLPADKVVMVYDEPRP